MKEYHIQKIKKNEKNFMISAIESINEYSFKQLESGLLPANGGIVNRIVNYVYQIFKFFIFLPICAVTSSSRFIATRFSRKTPEHPLVEFAKHPEWTTARSADASPVDIGFATAGFQDDGPSDEFTRFGLKGHPNTNWGEFYRNNPNAPHVGPNVPDFWGHPEAFIQRLIDSDIHHFRFSIDRDRIQPQQNDFINEPAMERYRYIIRLCKANGIEPMVTLVHFCDPLYHSWERAEDIPSLVNYAEIVCDMLAEEGIQKVITFNEPTVVAFQGWVMGKFPPHRKLDFAAAGRVLENMMRAHIEIYGRVKARHPELQIGLSHDPIRFRHYHKWNPLFNPIERFVCHYLSEINHKALMRYLLTGKFELKVPFRANYSFETRRPPVDFMGLQYYTDPLVKINLTGGSSVTRVPNERTATYQFRMYPQGLSSALYEMSLLGVPIDITEIGMDIGVNHDSTDSQRIEYFGRIFQVIQKALAYNIPVRSCYFWAGCNDNIEWHEGNKVKFGLHEFDWETGRCMPRPALEWLKKQQEHRHSAQPIAEAF